MRDAHRILRELRDAKKSNNDEIWLKTSEDNIRNWLGMIKGPNDTPFEGFYFEIEITIPDNYPIEAPIAKFRTPIFHPNVKFQDGQICLNILKDEWTPVWGVQTMCSAIQQLLSDPAPNSPLNTLAGNLLRYNDNVGYRSMVRMYARKFASTVNTFRLEAESQNPK